MVTFVGMDVGVVVVVVVVVAAAAAVAVSCTAAFPSLPPFALSLITGDWLIAAARVGHCFLTHWCIAKRTNLNNCTESDSGNSINVVRLAAI